MLVLSRKQGEKILINDDIIIEIVSIADGKVKLGITAPMTVPVHRKEIYDKIKSNDVNNK